MKRYANPVWLTLLLLIGGSALWFSGVAAKQIYVWLKLDQETVAQEVTWAVVPLRFDRFGFEGHYSFTVLGKRFHGKDASPTPPLRNEWAAKERLQTLKDERPIVFYSSSDPQLNALHNHFPLRASLSAGLLVVLFLYFLFLGFWVQGRV